MQTVDHLISDVYKYVHEGDATTFSKSSDRKLRLEIIK